MTCQLEVCNGLDDNCNGAIDDGNVCRVNRCICQPTTCAQQGVTCGTISDGCGTTLNCGSCGSGYICQGNQCVANCHPGCPASMYCVNGDLLVGRVRRRIYDPAQARFLSPDPVVSHPANGQSYNPYSYVLNNPTNLVDPSGWSDVPYGEVWTTVTYGPSSGAGGSDASLQRQIESALAQDPHATRPTRPAVIDDGNAMALRNSADNGSSMAATGVTELRPVDQPQGSWTAGCRRGFGTESAITWWTSRPPPRSGTWWDRSRSPGWSFPLRSPIRRGPRPATARGCCWGAWRPPRKGSDSLERAHRPRRGECLRAEREGPPGWTNGVLGRCNGHGRRQKPSRSRHGDRLPTG